MSEDVGGLVGDLIGDIIASTTAPGTRFEVGRDLPAWVSTVIYGPITNPTISFTDPCEFTRR